MNRAANEKAPETPTASLPEITVADGKIRVPGLRWKAQACELPGARWNPRLFAVELPATTASARSLASLGLSGVLAKELAAEEAGKAIARAYHAGKPLAPLPFPTPLEPWRHQVAAYGFAAAHRGCLLKMGMGAGKTFCAFALVRGLGLQQVLVVAPKSVIPSWVRWGERFGIPTLGLSQGSIAKRTRQAAAFLAGPGPRVVVINYESLWRSPFDSWALKANFDLVACDEIQKIKAPGGKASRFLAKLGPRVRYRLGLSGTPTPHEPVTDAYGICRFLDPGLFGTSLARHRARYAVLGGFEGREVVGYQNEAEFRDRLHSITFEVGRDVLDLPPVQHIERRVELGPEARRIYDDLQRDFIAWLGDAARTVTAANALGKLLRLQQLTSGYAQPDEEAEPVRVDGAKLAELREVLSELEPAEEVVVFCRFRADLDQVHEAAEGQSLELSGRRDELARWQAGERPVLAVQIQAGGTGIDLTRARYGIYLSLGFSLADYEQSLARLHRPGQERSTTFIHLIADRTVDERVYSALARRKRVIEEVLGFAGPAACGDKEPS